MVVRDKQETYKPKCKLYGGSYTMLLGQARAHPVWFVDCVVELSTFGNFWSGLCLWGWFSPVSYYTGYFVLLTQYTMDEN